MGKVPPLSPEAMRVLVSAYLATASPKRIRKMREAVQLTFGAAELGFKPPLDERDHAAHELVLIALDRAERKARRRRA